MTGALNWASQRAFKRLGRAMLVPLRQQIWSTVSACLDCARCFQCCRSKTSKVGKELELALRWFIEIMMEDLHEVSLEQGETAAYPPVV